jgi:hypothetical protein
MLSWKKFPLARLAAYPHPPVLGRGPDESASKKNEKLKDLRPWMR